MEYQKLSEAEEILATALVSAAYKIHKELGPGLLEKIYEACLVHELRKKGYVVDRQTFIPIQFDGLIFEEGMRLDIMLENKVIAEIKSVDVVNPVWQFQVLSQLKMAGKRLGFIINFNVPRIKDGIQRIIL